MSAENISGKAPGGVRSRLSEVLPLSTPILVQIFPVYACNMKCGYCIFSVKKSERHFVSDKPVMDLDLFKRCVDDMTRFPDKLKVLRFVGIGEPLLHKEIAEMVRYAADQEIAHTIEILTNGTKLTPALSDQLIASGLNRLVVSLQGLTSEKVREVSGVDIDVEQLSANLEYFYQNRKGVHVYIKIVDTALENEDDEALFYATYGNLCDTIAIEHTVPIHSGVEFEDKIKSLEVEQTQFGQAMEKINVCPQPFFHMQLNPDGKVVPCYSFEYPEVVGNVNSESLDKIWNGENFQRFRRKMLAGTSCASEVCSECNIIHYRLFPEDILDRDVDRLIPFYE